MSTATATAQATAPLELVPQPAALPATLPTGALAAPTVVTPADLLRIAMESGDKDIDRLERLMAMDERYRESQERDRKREAELAFRRDFAAFRGENITIPKTKAVDRKGAGSFMQAEYDMVCRLLSPALSAHGFGFRHDMKFGTRRWLGPIVDGGAPVEHDAPWVWVTCFLEHRAGHVETLALEGPPGDMAVNTPVQNMQVTGSYLKRQSLLAITGTATGGEDDESGMRGKRRAGPSDAPAADPAVENSLIDIGNEKATLGTKALTTWWQSLQDDQRAIVMPHFGAMKTAALQFDQDGGRK